MTSGDAFATRTKKYFPNSMCTHWKWPNKNTRKEEFQLYLLTVAACFLSNVHWRHSILYFLDFLHSEEIFWILIVINISVPVTKKRHKASFVPLSEELTQKGWILKINLKSGSGCISIVRATTRTSLWHLSVTLPANFRRFADSDSGSDWFLISPVRQILTIWHTTTENF